MDRTWMVFVTTKPRERPPRRPESSRIWVWDHPRWRPRCNLADHPQISPRGLTPCFRQEVSRVWRASCNNHHKRKVRRSPCNPVFKFDFESNFLKIQNLNYQILVWGAPSPGVSPPRDGFKNFDSTFRFKFSITLNFIHFFQNSKFYFKLIEVSIWRPQCRTPHYSPQLPKLLLSCSKTICDFEIFCLKF